jgi:myo-inositol-1(or 4)-monophosphatase
MRDEVLLGVLHDAADAVGGALRDLPNWGLSGRRAGQYLSDLAADAAALAVLDAAGLGVVSEESGTTGGHRPLVVALDPLDGSTNASRGIPWFATSLCAVDQEGPRAAVVADLVHGTRYEALRGSGSQVDGQAMSPSSCADLADAVVGLSGFPPRHLGWRQYRALGAVALDLCAVASGSLDAYIDCSPDAHGVWDHLAGALICREAGAHVVDAFDRPLDDLAHSARRTPVAAATRPLLDAVVSARRSDGNRP